MGEVPRSCFVFGVECNQVNEWLDLNLAQVMLSSKEKGDSAVLYGVNRGTHP
jgi:hypothetical protein